MKKLITTLVMGMSCFTTTVMAEIPTTNISFDTESHCSHFEGDMTDKSFMLDLQGNQKLAIATYEAYVDSVEDSNETELDDRGGELVWVYEIKDAGKYKVNTLGSEDDVIEFCLF